MVEDNPYSILAEFYDDAGFSNYSTVMTPRLFKYLQENGWMGKRILDLGCGTGISTAFFGSAMMTVTGIDSSPDMLRVAALRVDDMGYDVELREGDIRQLTDYPATVELVYCVGNVLNEMRNLREIEMLFSGAFAALQPGKLFVFDMSTLKGVIEQFGNSELILDVSDRLFITVQNQLLHDQMAVRQHITCFSSNNGEDWSRAHTFLTLRGYPFVGVIKLLEKIGFTVKGAFDTAFRPFDTNRDADGRVIVIAQKPE